MPIFRSQTWGCDCINISPNLIKKTRELLLFTIKFKKNKKHLITSLVPTQLQRLLAKSLCNWVGTNDVIKCFLFFLNLIVKSKSSRVFFIKFGEILIQSHPQV